ncbi:MAG: carboxy-S-adenosyl-L-methionine synthase CmoA [Candidatus Thiodiazotropha sp. (ex Gloverina cf. vestifex)]|nr:carboxy-S-adenosyl-L-methionine synthase CmoA [Candidatus Thiodiazotropha sp. (ex Gloverina cf. vestifex)]
MTDNPDKDRLYTRHREVVADFVFDERVAEVFPDMIQRSVPGYTTTINMIGTLAARCVTQDSHCYDLGCSLGAAALAINRGRGETVCRIIAVDNSPAMVQRAKRYLFQTGEPSAIEFVCADIKNIGITSASMVVLNFTLQFIPVEKRSQLLTSIYEGMQPGGALILSEKIALPTETAQQLFTDMHHSFKKTQGYSELEISQKCTALKKVLLPETLSTHQTRLRDVGFKTVEVWFQCFNFVSLLAVK